MGNFSLWWETLENFRDQSPLLVEHLSPKLTLAHPIFWPKNVVFRVQKYPRKLFFSGFCQKADWTSGQNIPNPKYRLPKSFFLLELQEFEIRTCVQPSAPIIILILLPAFQKFAMSMGAKHQCFFSSILGTFSVVVTGSAQWHQDYWFKSSLPDSWNPQSVKKSICQEKSSRQWGSLSVTKNHQFQSVGYPCQWRKSVCVSRKIITSLKGLWMSKNDTDCDFESESQKIWQRQSRSGPIRAECRRHKARRREHPKMPAIQSRSAAA